MTRKIFGKTCLFLLAVTFLFENSGFLTHELSIAVGIIFLTAFTVSYFCVAGATPVKVGSKSADLIIRGIVLMVLGVAVVPVSEFLRPAGVAVFALGLGLLLKGLGQEASELPLFALTAAGYGVFNVFYRVDPHVWSVVNGACFGFSRLVAAVTGWLPGPKALLGPAFLGAGTIVTFGLFFILGSFMLKPSNGARHYLFAKLVKSLAAMVACGAVYVIAFTYVPSAFQYQLKLGPVPSEAEKNTTKQAQDQMRDRDLPRTESEKATKVVFSTDMFEVEKGTPWMPIVLFGFLLIPSYFFLKNAELRPIPVLGKTEFAAGGAVLLVLFGFTQASVLNVPSARTRQETVSKKRVAFYHHGFANWARADFNSFGSRSSGMFGNLPDFVESMGFRQPVPEQRNEAGYAKCGVLINEITPETLKDVDILMLLNVDDMFNSEDPPRGIDPSPALKARKAALAACKTDDDRIALMRKHHKEALDLIWNFVADGGSLLIIGDHTFLKETQLPGGRVETKLWLNEVLEPFDIKFVNDSAKYFIGGWLQSMENPVHPLTWGMRDDQNEVGMVVGASLSATGAARPIIVGRYGFLDAGDMREGSRGYLGNLDFDMGEPLGQTIISATQQFGKGKLLVFGDTSAFANGIITNTGEFINRVFTYMAQGGEKPDIQKLASRQFVADTVSRPSGGLMTFVAIVLLAGAVVCLAMSGGSSEVVAGAFVVCALIGFRGTDMTVTLGPGGNRTPRDASAVRIAYVDSYHMPKISNEGWRDDGVMGLHLNLMRNGFYTQNLKSFDLKTLQKAALLVVVAPSVKFSKSDVQTVRDYVAGGGTVILTAGYEDIAATRPLLDAFNLDIPYTPLGRFMIPPPNAVGPWFGNVPPNLNVLMGQVSVAAGASGQSQVTLAGSSVRYSLAPNAIAMDLARTFSGKNVDVSGTFRMKNGMNELEIDCFRKHEYVRFWRIWPIKSTGSDPLEVIIPYEPTQGNKLSLGVKRSFGTNGGSFILVADSGLWMNKNLEREESHDIESIDFMKWMLETYVPRK